MPPKPRKNDAAAWLAGMANAASEAVLGKSEEAIQQEAEAAAAAAAAARDAQRRSGTGLFIRAVSSKPEFSSTLPHDKSGGLEFVHQPPGYEALRGRAGIQTINGRKVIGGARQPDIALTWYIDGFPCMIVISNENSSTSLTGGPDSLYTNLDKTLPAILHDTYNKLKRFDLKEGDVDTLLLTPLKEIQKIIRALNKRGASINPSVLVVVTYPRFRHADPKPDSPYSTLISAKGTGDIFAGIEYTDSLDRQRKTLAIRPAFRVHTARNDDLKPKITEDNIYGKKLNFWTYTQEVSDRYLKVTLFATTGILAITPLQPMDPIPLPDGNTVCGRTIISTGLDPRTITSTVLGSLTPDSDVETGGLCAYLDVPTPAERGALLAIQNSDPSSRAHFIRLTSKDKQDAVAAIARSNEAHNPSKARRAAPASAAAAAPRSAPAEKKASPTAPPPRNDAIARDAAASDAAAAAKRAEAAAAAPKPITTAAGVIAILESFSPENDCDLREKKQLVLKYFLENPGAATDQCELKEQVGDPKRGLSLSQFELVALFDRLNQVHDSKSSADKPLKYLFKSLVNPVVGVLGFGIKNPDTRPSYTLTSQKLLTAIKNRLMAGIDLKMKSSGLTLFSDGSIETQGRGANKKKEFDRVFNTPVDGTKYEKEKRTPLGIKFNSYFS